MTRRRRLALLLALSATAALVAVDAASKVEAAKLTKHATDQPAANAAPSSTPDASAADDARAHIPPSFPKTVEEAKAEAEAAKKPPSKWSDADIASAKAQCTAILQRIHAVAIPHEPIKEGACGAPAPIELVAIGRNPEVALSPPAIITCPLAEGLATWLRQDLQPLAQKHFQAPIVRIETMSSYSCRNAYGRKKTKLSEHGLANAVDIRGFVMASAKTAYVLEDWGMPQREIAAKIAAAKAADAKHAADLAAAQKAAQSNLASTKGEAGVEAPTTPPATIGAAAAGLAKSTIVDGIPKLTVTLPGATLPAGASSLSAVEPDRLGGPVWRPDAGAGKPVNATTLVGLGVDDDSSRGMAQREFLHEAHAAACRIFGTTLGPEANAAHRNHIHVDMAPRPIIKICD